MNRRYLTFSLRTLFVVTTALAVWLGVIVNRAREQREAVKAIKALGGLVQYDWQKYILRQIGEEPTGPAWLRRIVGDDYFQNTDTVWLVEIPESGIVKSIPVLRRLPKLKYVVVVGPVSKKSQDELKVAMPRCEVLFDF